MTKDPKKPSKPLGITCLGSDCENNLHCFKKSRKMAETDRGKCRTCGADLIDWKRVHQRDLVDAQFTFDALSKEFIRHYYWHIPIDEKAQRKARNKKTAEIKEAVKKRLVKSIAPINNVWDGRQTPYDGNIIYYAQHAVACCCRKCMEYWHGIPRKAELTEDQINYFTDLMMMYINDRMPDLLERESINSTTDQV
jgi:hypothetical protein